MTVQTAPAEATVLPAVHRGGRATVLGLAGTAVVLLTMAALPYVVESGVTAQLVKLCYLVALASMWNLLAGYAGMMSMGQQAFIGLGAYLLFVVNDHGVNVYAGTLVVSAAVALLAWPVSYLAFRLRGGYFAVGTWVIAEVVRLIVVRFDSLGAASGRTLSDVTTDPVLRRAFTYWLALAVMATAVLGTYAVLRSRLGLSLQAIRDDDTAAASLGVNVTRGKRIIYITAAAGCAAAGAVICVNSLGVASPTQIFGVQYSALMVFMVIIGGIGTIEGPVVGAITYFLLDKYFAQSGVWYLIVVGAAAIVVSLYLPRGLWGTLAHRTGIAVFPVRHTVRS
ncbi:amino acid/amide ABC transporter membrane protein 2 (HAAT family) [Streptomyces sp. TLI_55]|uniref:branched-chain amino acid ABC transporter permease n=1 Tax=Streptomyces sp. TLI_55 TaxID=1938861 RepID=UPI000BC61E3B|nr:branched-chain amino acid ABC transporter permease [Streptomyces sp. TLI_55]SNX66650.1 amino acid/amide ABC transporter membrane protein 2 (HAAT family) [Streptomyces sp. TLI_55]